jgi:MFS transporter, MHS family, proline/betaine transporter
MDINPNESVIDDELSDRSTLSASSARRTILACIFGNTLEWYDFVIYGYFAAIFGSLFFPSADPLTQLLSSWAVFWSGFIARPLGSIFFGHLGDKTSRKFSLTLSIYLMAIPTTLIGLMPTYAQVGISATIVLILLRTLQGFALGGGYTGAMVFLVEHAPAHKKGIWGSWIAFSAISGVILGSTVLALLSSALTEEAMTSWGWRIPFIASVFGGFLGNYMRNNLQESEEYVAVKAARREHQVPLVEIFKNHKSKIMRIIFLDFLTAIGFFIISIYLASYFKIYLNIPGNQAFWINTLNVLIFAAATIAGGWFTDKGYPYKVLIYPCIAIVLLAYPLFILMQSKSLFMIFFAQAILALLFGLFFGALPNVLVKVFPTNIRCSGLSLSHNLSMAIFGGSAPFLATWLIATTSNVAAPAFMLVAAAGLSLLGFLRIK